MQCTCVLASSLAKLSRAVVGPNGHAPIPRDLWPSQCPLHWSGRVRFSHMEDPCGMATGRELSVCERLLIVWKWIYSTHTGSGCGGVVVECHCVLLSRLVCGLAVGGQSKFLGHPWGRRWCCYGCVFAPPSFRSIEYTKCTLQALAATPLQRNKSGWVCFTSWMSFMWCTRSPPLILLFLHLIFKTAAVPANINDLKIQFNLRPNFVREILHLSCMCRAVCIHVTKSIIMWHTQAGHKN